MISKNFDIYYFSYLCHLCSPYIIIIVAVSAAFEQSKTYIHTYIHIYIYIIAHVLFLFHVAY